MALAISRSSKIMYEVTLIYSNGNSWFAGGFSTLEATQAWIENEKSMPYWNSATKIEIVDKNLK